MSAAFKGRAAVLGELARPPAVSLCGSSGQVQVELHFAPPPAGGLQVLAVMGWCGSTDQPAEAYSGALAWAQRHPPGTELGVVGEALHPHHLPGGQLALRLQGPVALLELAAARTAASTQSAGAG